MLTFNGLSPIHLAIQNCHLQTLHYLLQEFPGGYWLNHRESVHGRTPILYCCIYGFKDGLKLLLDKGADYTIVDNYGNNLLHTAFEYGNFDCIQIFVDHLFNSSVNKTLNLKLIKLFENSKNQKGWLPIELSIDFKLTSTYKLYKKSLRSEGSDSDSFTGTASRSASRSSGLSFSLNQFRDSQMSLVDSESDNLPSTSPLAAVVPQVPQQTSPNKVLSSPILSLNEFQKRTHSQSLPTQNEEEIPSVGRQRAYTAISQPSNPLSPPVVSHGTMSPTTPVMKKTSSLKSLTISPSIRLNTDIDNIDVESNSSNTTTESSPIKQAFPRMKSSTSISTQRTRSRTGSSSNNEDTVSLDSPSSIAARIAFNGNTSRKNSASGLEFTPARISSPHLRREGSGHSIQQVAKPQASPGKQKSINSISFSRVR